MQLLTYKQVLEAIDHAVARMGEDFVYTKERVRGCTYRPSPKGRQDTGCIIGEALTELGIDMSVFDFPSDDGPAASRGINDCFDDIKEQGFMFTEPVMDALVQTQEVQDVGATWGYARQVFIDSYTSLKNNT